MKNIKAQLLAATVVAAGFPTIAQAQFAYPAAELRGVGASSIQNVLVQTLNCNGNPGSHAVGNTANLNQLGTSSGSLSNVAEGKFTQVNPTVASPDFDCNLQEVQENVEGKYVATGSGFGRTTWRTFTNQFNPAAGTTNPFGTWSNVQFAFSDAPASASDLTGYDAGAGAAGAGAPIQFPMFVLPVALAYNPVYGQLRTAAGPAGVTDLSFNLKPAYVTKDSAGNPTGGIRMTQNNYCKIFNGVITNWNDAALRINGVANSLMDPADNAARWRTEGAPIRLVGRLDNSGTTDIFTRHLAAACTGQAGVPSNKFAKAAEALPFDNTSAIDLRSFRSDSRYYTGRASGDFAGTVQSLSGAVFVRASGSNPARIDTTQGAEQAGLFMVADGSSGVRDAVNYQETPAGRIGSLALNGKLGYIGADFVRPSAGASLFSAALQIGGTGGRYAAPTAAQGIAAFGNRFLPPQTTSVNGAYNPNGDTRTGPRRDGQAGTVAIDRANPLHWTSVLYSDPANTLANPRLGYPLTGVTMYLGYTCYATDANRLAITEFLSLYAGRVRKDSQNNNVSINLVKGTAPASPGLLAQNGIAPMPASWLNAIAETFLKKSTQSGLGNRNLWIQSALPAKNVRQATSNPTCTAGQGA